MLTAALCVIIVLLVAISFYLFRSGRIAVFELSKITESASFEADIKKRLEMELDFAKQQLRDSAIKNDRLIDENKYLNIEIAKLNQQIVSQEQIERHMEQQKQDRSQANREMFEKISMISTKAFSELSEKTYKNFVEITEKTSASIDEKSQKSSQEFINKWGEVVKNLSVLQSKIIKNEGDISQITKVFTSSNHTGSHAEQHLENHLISSGFQKDVDFYSQFVAENLRADFVLKIPHSGKTDIWIIDCKSTQSWLTDDAGDKIVSSFQKSLDDFSRKDYKNKITSQLAKTIGKENVGTTTMIMYLPFDAMLIKLAEIKPTFLESARENGVFIVTPTIFFQLINVAMIYKNNSIISKEYEKVIDMVSEFIKRFGTLLEYYEKTGKSLAQTCKHYQEFSSSLNNRFIPYAKKAGKLLNIGSKQDFGQIKTFSLIENAEVVERPDDVDLLN